MLAVCGSAPDHAALLHAFVPEERNSSEPRAPSHTRRGAISPQSVASSRVRADTHSALLRELRARRSGVDASRGCGLSHANVRPVVEPRLVASRTPHGHPPGSHSVGTTRYVRSMGRRATRSARGATLRRAASSVTRPAKGEILVELEVPSVHPTESHAWDTSDDVRCEVALVAAVTRWLSVSLRLVDGQALALASRGDREEENAVPESRRL